MSAARFIHGLVEQMLHEAIARFGADLPWIERVQMWHNNADLSIDLRIDFSNGYRAQRSISEHGLYESDEPWPSFPALVDIAQTTAHALYSQLVEDHHVNRRVDALRQTLIEAENAGAHPAELVALYRQAHHQEEHARRHHRYRLNAHEMTATEMRLRTQEAQRRLSQQLGQRMDEEILRSLELPGRNAEPATSTLTAEQAIEQAYRLLRGNDEDDRRRAFDEIYDWDSTRHLRERRERNERYLRSPEEIERMRQEAARIDKERQAARERATALLNENLTPAQKESLEEKRYFDVKGGQSGRTYRIKVGRQQNIWELNDKGEAMTGLCFLPQGGLVEEDCMLAQKNALELFEDKALKIANKFPADYCPVAPPAASRPTPGPSGWLEAGAVTWLEEAPNYSDGMIARLYRTFAGRR